MMNSICKTCLIPVCECTCEHPYFNNLPKVLDNTPLLITLVDKREADKQQAGLVELLTEAMELLNEVKPYRGLFYKQKVAELATRFNKLKP